jgi:hypothetical protein
MSGSFEQWRIADEEWLDRNLTLLELVLQWFLDHNEWPKVEPLQRTLYRTGDRETKVREIANARPSIPGQTNFGVNPVIQLSARHLIRIPAAQNLLEATVVATVAAVKAFLSSEDLDQQVSIKSEDVRATWPHADDEILRLLPPFVWSDHPTPFAGGGGGVEGWSLMVDENLIMRFEGVTTSKQYVERQLEIIHGWCEDHDARLGSVQKGGPLKAFIVMPFHEPWSDSVHSFIKRAAESLGETIIAMRADDIFDPGRINDQIVNELQACDFIIADITGNNFNVGWEMGFAYALNKPCVIVRQKDVAGPQPFDIYDHRRIEFSAESTSEEVARLVNAIRGAITQAQTTTSRTQMSLDFKLP